jgi:hypothetical protein
MTEINVVMKGNPGIGKTWALNYILYCLLRQNQNVAIVGLSKLHYFDSRTHKAFYYPDRERWKLLRGAWRTDQGAQHIMLVDAGKGIPAPADVDWLRCVVASSPEPSNWDQFHRQSGAKIFHIHMWTMVELSAARATVFNDELDVDMMQARVQQVGRVPRFVFGTQKAFGDAVELMKVAVSEVDLSSLHRYSENLKHRELPSHKIMALLMDGTYEFLSDMIRVEFVRRIRGLKHYELRQLYLGLLEARDFTGPAAGDALEAYFHRMAQRTNGFIARVAAKAKSLHDAVVAVHPPKITGKLNISIFQRHGNEPLARGDTYYQPFDTNFPVVDSFVVVDDDVVAFQVTNVEDHRPTVNAVIDFFAAMEELGLDFESPPSHSASDLVLPQEGSD